MKNLIPTLLLICLLISFASGEGFVITEIKNVLSQGFVITEVVEESEEDLEIERLKKEAEKLRIRLKEIEDKIKQLENVKVKDPVVSNVNRPWIGPIKQKDASLRNVEWKHERIKTGCVDGICYYEDRFWFREK